MQGSSGPCYAGDRCKKLPGADHATGFDSVDKNELLGGANHPCSGQCGKHLHGLCTGMFRDASAGEDGTEWTCQECGGPWPPTAISKEASPVDFKEKVVDAQLAGLGALYSLGGKGKVVKVPSRKLVKLAKVIVDGRVDDGELGSGDNIDEGHVDDDATGGGVEEKNGPGGVALGGGVEEESGAGGNGAMGDGEEEKNGAGGNGAMGDGEEEKNGAGGNGAMGDGEEEKNGAGYGAMGDGEEEKNGAGKGAMGDGNQDKSGQGDAALRAAMGPTVGKHAVGGAHIPVVERDASKKENTPGPAAGTFRASASRHFDVGDTRKELAFSPPPAGPGMHKTPGGASTSDSEDDIVALAIPEWPHVGVVVGAIASSSICAHFVRQSRYKKFKNLLDRLKGSPTRRPSAIGFFDAVVIVVNDKNATTFPTTLGLEHKGVLPSSAWNEDMQAVMSWAIKNKADLLPQILKEEVEDCSARDLPARESAIKIV
eukprot:jgi/Mesvir1/13903/Mv16028-RA.1